SLKSLYFLFQAEDGIRDRNVTGVQTCALPISILLDCVGEQFGEVLRGIIHDRESGGFTLGLEGVTEDTDEYVIFATAITHLIGLPNHDAMSGKYYARFTVKHTDNSDSY